MSRYLFQILHRQFGQSNQLLKNIRTYLNVQQLLPVNVYCHLILVRANLYENLPFKGDDMELFVLCFKIPADKINDILKDLILNKKFIFFSQKICHQIISCDGFSDMIIAKAIVNRPYLVNLWKQIRYHEICNDYNNFVFQWILIKLFPSSSAIDWICPSTKTVISSLDEFIGLGFKLNDKAIINILIDFKDQLCDIREILWDIFFASELNNIYTIKKVLQESIMKEEDIDAIQNFLQYIEINKTDFP